MRLSETHISDEDLILLEDGELASQREERLRRHLGTCSACNRRSIEMHRKLSEIAAVYAEQRPKQWDALGPRALLKARLAQETHSAASPKSTWSGRGLRVASVAAPVLILGVALGVQFAHRGGTHSAATATASLPDQRLTPGAVRSSTLADLCVKDGEETVRQVPASIQREVLKEYGIRPEASSKYEIDYLITPGLGGTDDVKNLWPEPHADTPWNSFTKDMLEDRLHRMVCSGAIPLDQAQRDIAGNWIAAYKKYYRATGGGKSSMTPVTHLLASL